MAATAADGGIFTAPSAVVDRVAARPATSCAEREAAMMASAAAATAAAGADTTTKEVAVAALAPLSPWLATAVKDADNVNYSVSEGAKCATVDRGHSVTGPTSAVASLLLQWTETACGLRGGAAPAPECAVLDWRKAD